MNSIWQRIERVISITVLCGAIGTAIYAVKQMADLTEAVKEFQKFQQKQYEINGKTEVINNIVINKLVNGE